MMITMTIIVISGWYNGWCPSSWHSREQRAYTPGCSRWKLSWSWWKLSFVHDNDDNNEGLYSISTEPGRSIGGSGVLPWWHVACGAISFIKIITIIINIIIIIILIIIVLIIILKINTFGNFIIVVIFIDIKVGGHDRVLHLFKFETKGIKSLKPKINDKYQIKIGFRQMKCKTTNKS